MSYLPGISSLLYQKTIPADTRKWIAPDRFPGKPPRILLDNALAILQLKTKIFMVYVMLRVWKYLSMQSYERIYFTIKITEAIYDIATYVRELPCARPRFPSRSVFRISKE